MPGLQGDSHLRAPHPRHCPDLYAYRHEVGLAVEEHEVAGWIGGLFQRQRTDFRESSIENAQRGFSHPHDDKVWAAMCPSRICKCAKGHSDRMGAEADRSLH